MGYSSVADLEKDYARLLRSEEFETLEAQISRPNIFQILRVGEREIRHSNFLGWLLDPNESHALGDKFLSKVLLDLIPDQVEASGLSVVDISSLAKESIVVRREWRNIDLLIEGETFILCIENKIYAGESESQLSKYRNIVERAYPKSEGYRHLFVFLTPEGINPQGDDRYLSYSYVRIVALLERLLLSASLAADGRIALYVQDYIESLKRTVIMEENVNELARRIYAEHKELIDFIVDNRPDNEPTAKEIFEEIVRGYGWKICSDNKGYVRFLTPELYQLIPRNGTGWKQKEIFAFELEFFWGKARMTFRTVISPGDEATRDRLSAVLDKMEQSKQPRGKQWLCHIITNTQYDIDALIGGSEDELQKVRAFFGEAVVPIVRDVGQLLVNELSNPVQSA